MTTRSIHPTSTMRYLFFCIASMFCLPLSAQWASTGTGTTNTLGLTAVWGINDQTACVTTDGGSVLRTANGGSTWTQYLIPGGGVELLDIVFTSPQDGIAVGSSGLGTPAAFRSVNGGMSWTSVLQAPSGFLLRFRKVNFPSPQVGYVVGDNGFAYKTSDAGFTWTPLNLGTTVSLIDVNFPDEANGYVVAVNNSDPVLYRTTDGGLNWSATPLPVQGNDQRIRFFDALHGYLLDFNTGLFETIDGGQSWQSIGPLPASFRSVYFADPLTGWIGGGAGDIFKTTDGGTTWLKQVNQDGRSIKGLHFADGRGWAVTGKISGTNKIYTTTNGGGLGIGIAGLGQPTCPGDILYLECLHNGATSFEWKVNNVPFGGNQPAITLGPLTNGTTTISCTASNGNETVSVQQSIAVLDNIQPFSVSLAQDSFCLGGQAQFTFGPITSYQEYSIRVGDSILWQNTVSQNNAPPVNWTSAVLDSTTTFDFWIKYSYCDGLRKLASVTVHVMPIPDTTMEASLVQNTICENTPVTIHLSNTEPGVFYQVFAGGQAFGVPVMGDQTVSAPLPESGHLQIRAAYSSQCYRFLDTAVAVTVMQAAPFFAASPRYAALNEPVYLENTSADSLAFQWTFSGSADVSTSTLQHPAPLHFNATDTSQITLLVTTPSGCKDSLVVPIVVYDTAALGQYWAIEQKIYMGGRFIPDSDGNIYGGLNGGTLNSRLPGSQIEDNQFIQIIYKYNKFGVLQWANRYKKGSNLPMSNTLLNDICIDKQGNSYVLFRLNNANIKKAIPSTDGRDYITDKAAGALIVKYSPNGVLLWAHTLESIADPACPFQNPTLLGTSMAVDDDGSVFLTGALSVVTDCAEFLFTNFQGDTQILDLGSSGSRFFTAKIDGTAGVLQWIKNHNAANGDFSAIEVESDKAGGCYTWSRNTWNDDASRLLHISPAGEALWSLFLNSGGGHSLANDLAVDQWGNAIVVATHYGLTSISGDIKFTSSQFNPTDYTGNIILKVAPDGTFKWGRFIIAGVGDTNDWTHGSMGVDVDGDKIYTITHAGGGNLFGFATLYACASVPHASPLYLTVWDSLGNLIELQPVGTAFLGSSLGGVYQTIQVQDGIIYTCNQNIDSPTTAVFGYPITAQPLGSTYYLARVPDPKIYLPYITSPNVNLGVICNFRGCLNDSSKQIMVSYLFDSIQWYRNADALLGYTTPGIVPPLVGSYEVTAVNTNGELVSTPNPMNVLSVDPMLMPAISQSGDTLKTQFVQGAYNIWRDSTGTIIHISDVGDTIFLPPWPGLWQVEVVLTLPCGNTSPPYYFDPIVATSDVSGIDMSLTIMPNPLQSETTVTYRIPDNAPVRLSVYDILGKERAVLLDIEHGSSGVLQLNTNEHRLAPGIYFLCLSSNGTSRIKRMVIAR